MTKDTDHKIFGRDWSDIQDMQMKRYRAPIIDVTAPLPTATDADRELLVQYGSIAALELAGLYGVVDRLNREVAK